jgi:hypothetical protein
MVDYCNGQHLVLKTCCILQVLGPLHTRDWEPVIIMLQALSLVEKAELVQVRFTLMLEGPTESVDARWIHGFLHGIERIMFHGHLDYFQKPPLGGWPNTKPGDIASPNAHNRRFILIYHVWGSAWINIRWNNIWLRTRSWIYDFTLRLKVHDHTTRFWRCVGTAFSFGLSQFHGHNSWLMCEVALSDLLQASRKPHSIVFFFWLN